MQKTSTISCGTCLSIDPYLDLEHVGLQHELWDQVIWTAAHLRDTGRQARSERESLRLQSNFVWVSSNTIELQLLIRAHDIVAEAVQLKLHAMLWPGCLEVVFATTSNDYIVDLEHHTA